MGLARLSLDPATGIGRFTALRPSTSASRRLPIHRIAAARSALLNERVLYGIGLGVRAWDVRGRLEGGRECVLEEAGALPSGFSGLLTRGVARASGVDGFIGMLGEGRREGQSKEGNSDEGERCFRGRAVGEGW